MSGHVAAETWADAFAGRLDDAARGRIEQHAAGCPACAKVKARVGRASDTYASIRQQASPELPWDSVRARVHWSVSKERRSRPPAKPRFELPRPARWAIGIALAGGIAVTAMQLVTSSSEPAESRTVQAPVALPAPLAPAPAPEALAGLVNRMSGEVMIDGVRAADVFARRLTAGTVIATGAASNVDVQFGDASAFALGPRSTLELRAFDAQTIELVVDGTLDVEVAPRKTGQRFLVIAGDHTIEVRGTQFRVRREAAGTTVACRHGLVAVRDRAASQVEIGTARGLRIAAGAPLAADRIAPLTVDELAELADATPLRLPLWHADTAALVGSTAPLEIATVGARDVRIDGVELGRAPLVVRVMPGRHTVEAADSAGRFRRAGWVDVPAPSTDATRARLEVPAEPAPTAGIAARRRELRAGIDSARLASCTRSIAKAGLSDTYVHIELAVDERGAVGFLNVIDTDLPSSTARCVREALADVRFGAGAPATWRERIDL